MTPQRDPGTVNLRLILVSGKTQDFTFSPDDSATDIAKHVFDNWPAGWEEEQVSSPSILRLIFQGRFLHGNVTLGALKLPPGRTTVMHLVARETLPEPNSNERRNKDKSTESSCCLLLSVGLRSSSRPRWIIGLFQSPAVHHHPVDKFIFSPSLKVDPIPFKPTVGLGSPELAPDGLSTAHISGLWSTAELDTPASDQPQLLWPQGDWQLIFTPPRLLRMELQQRTRHTGPGVETFTSSSAAKGEPGPSQVYTSGTVGAEPIPPHVAVPDPPGSASGSFKSSDTHLRLSSLELRDAGEPPERSPPRGVTRALCGRRFAEVVVHPAMMPRLRITVFSSPVLLLLLLIPPSLSSSQEPPVAHNAHLPSLVAHAPRSLSRSHFSAQAQLDFTTHCNASCFHREPSLEELTEQLAFETLYSDGSRTLTTVDLEDDEKDVWPPTRRRRSVPVKQRQRRKRQIYGADGRFNIRGEKFLLDYPFSTAVRISTGCTGVLVSPRHVLTAAHCVHNGKDYVKGARKLRVGFLTPLSSNRTGTGKLPPRKPQVRWVYVQRTHVPKGWTRPQEVSMDFDYALLELRSPHRRPFMRLSVAPPSNEIAGRRVHFSGFDSDRPGELVYRFCPVEDESNDLIYQHCDARPGASGSGVYGRVWDAAVERWERKVIGIFSGHQWLEINGENRDFNVAVRFTPQKFAQICYWVHRNRVDCSQD
ncbi:serine protease 23-like isoform X1 [Arapaima gigas]